MKALMDIQQELKAPKNLYNSFGKYSYRSAEGILESVKPLLAKHNCVLTLSDDLTECAGRPFLKAKVVLKDIKSGEEVYTEAYAEIAADKKGMDASQITGTASSYARKYALNGLFCIDDTKDADTDEYKTASENYQRKAAPKKEPLDIGDREASDLERRVFQEACQKHGLEPLNVLAHVGWKSGKMKVSEYKKSMDYIDSVSIDG